MAPKLGWHLVNRVVMTSFIPRPHPLPYRLQYKEREGLGELIT